MLLLLVLAVEQLSAQTAFITQYQSSQISMTTANTNRYTALQSDLQNQSVKIVATADVRTKQVNGKLSFLLPGLPDSIHAEATLIRDDATGFTWSGKITNQPGYVSFLKLNGLTSGFIQVGYHFYEFMPMGANYQFLVERAVGRDKACGSPGMPADSTSLQPIGPDYCTSIGEIANNCPALIYMLLVITPAAKDYILNTYGDIPSFVTQGQNAINLAFANSGIPNKEVAIKWIEKDLTQANASLSYPADIETDRVKLPDLLEPERTNYKADMAFLITNQGYSNAGGAVFGFGPNKATAYGLVEASYFITYYSVAHELGHLLGCHHNWTVTAGDDDLQTCAHGYRWIENVGPVVPLQTYQVDESWQTLLGISVLPAPFVYEQLDEDDQLYYVQFTAAAGANRILHYSNPDVIYDGKPTGVISTNSANNARLIRNSACEAAAFFESQDLSLFITTSNCSTLPFTFTANIIPPEAGLPGQGPYTVTWYWNKNGNFNTSFWSGGNELPFGSGQTLTISAHPFCKVYWVKCKVVAADGTTLVRFKKIDLTPLYCDCVPQAPGGDGDGRSAASSVTTNNGYSFIYPNPVGNGVITIENQALVNAEAQTTVTDLSGRTVLQMPVSFDHNGQVHLQVDHLPDGLYLLRLNQNNGAYHNLKFTIAKK